MESLRSRKIKALYDWLINQGTPSRIASLFIHTATWRVIDEIIKDENITIPKA